MKDRSAFAEFALRFARNRGALLGIIIIVVVLGLALAAPWLIEQNPLRIVSRPEVWPFTNPRYPLGTDSIGRNILAMIAYGARTTLMIGIVAALTATAIGVVIGAAAAWFGGWIDEVLTRITELFQTVPNILLIMTVVAILGQTIDNITMAIGVTMWPGIARLTRAEFLTLKNREFVLACRSMGMSNIRIMAGEILPNAIPPVIVLASVIIGSSILFESAISFLGLGDPNVASWGALIGDGRTLIRRSWYICAIPGVAIMLTVLAMNLIGDGLNDALNPKLRDR
ncbi:Binding-protein-dependent transport systems inner membrane component [Rhodopseudomonas palustris HaA2]|uniref:Binding-protein-dependent transport systems inner membrane component n=1 Tax=Rhodopseudomonas palustris (strain HaA2) TaxID=316058 RepID=Q2IVI1_RHOP2|nr:Binding-protein-dependent transport systems inner membrane component [Rhodopseudomonas palustris HaA2]